MMVVGAALGLLSVRPDADDVGHLAKAVWQFESCGEPLVAAEPIAFRPGGDVYLPDLSSHESFCAVLAIVGRVTPLAVYHHVLSAGGGALLPLVWFIFLRRVSSTEEAACFGSLLVVLFLCLEGSTHRAPGNFAFVRIWQGKALLFTVLLPVVSAYFIDFLRSGGAARAGRVVAASIAGFGLSTTAAFLLPIQCAALGIGWWAQDRRSTVLGRWALGGILVAIYPVAWVFGLRSEQGVLLGARVQSTTAVDVSLAETWAFVFGPGVGLSVIASLLALGVLFWKRNRRGATWILVWSAALLLPLAIPGMANWTARNLTTPWVFWRILYAVPVAPLIGVAGATWYAALGRRKAAHLAIGVAALAVAALVALPAGSLPPWASDSVRFPALSLKLPSQDFQAASDLARSLDRGPMLAPRYVSRTLPLLTARFPQFSFRGRFWQPDSPTPDEMLVRLVGAELDPRLGLRPQALAALEQELERPYRYIVLKKPADLEEDVVAMLGAAGFRRTEFGGESLVVFERPPQTDYP